MTAQIGVVGGGFIGKALGQQFVDDGRAELAGVADPSTEARLEFAEAFSLGNDSLFGDFETMLATTDLDAVVVASPHVHHPRQVRLALEADLDVLCEKPLAITVDTAQDIHRLASRSDQQVMMGYQRHLSPAYSAIRDQISNDTPDIVTAEIHQNWISAHEEEWRVCPDVSGGGFLYDTGIHLVDIILWTTQLTPMAVSAEMDFVSEGVDKWASMTIRFEEGGRATITASGENVCVREHVHIWSGDRGYYVNGKGWDQRQLTTIDADGAEQRIDHEPRPTKPEIFLDTIESRSVPPATTLDGLRATTVIEAAYEAAKRGATVELPTERLAITD